MAVSTFGNNIVGAFTGGGPVTAIYMGSTKVWPSSSPSVYIEWYSYPKYGVLFFSTGVHVNLRDPQSDIESMPGFYFSLSNNNKNGVLYFPAEYDGKFSYQGTSENGIQSFYGNITSIKSDAFYYMNDTLVTVSFSECKYIGSGAFRSASNLRNAYFQKCEYIGGSAFVNCSSLSNLVIPKCKHIGERAFYKDIGLTSLNLEECEYIESAAFDWCYNISEINIPVCSYIDDHAFWRCSALQSVSLPRCEYLGTHVFVDTAISSLYLPACKSTGGFGWSNITVDLPVCSYISEMAPGVKLYLRSNSVVEIGSFYSASYFSTSTHIYVPSSLYSDYIDRYSSDVMWSWVIQSIPESTP